MLRYTVAAAASAATSRTVVVRSFVERIARKGFTCSSSPDSRARLHASRHHQPVFITGAPRHTVGPVARLALKLLFVSKQRLRNPAPCLPSSPRGCKTVAIAEVERSVSGDSTRELRLQHRLHTPSPPNRQRPQIAPVLASQEGWNIALKETQGVAWRQRRHLLLLRCLIHTTDADPLGCLQLLARAEAFYWACTATCSPRQYSWRRRTEIRGSTPRPALPADSQIRKHRLAFQSLPQTQALLNLDSTNSSHRPSHVGPDHALS